MAYCFLHLSVFCFGTLFALVFFFFSFLLATSHVLLSILIFFHPMFSFKAIYCFHPIYCCFHPSLILTPLLSLSSTITAPYLLLVPSCTFTHLNNMASLNLEQSICSSFGFAPSGS
ncbi:hypothetical protein AMTRI_Chr01g132650 [Amborella trichopoda]